MMISQLLKTFAISILFASASNATSFGEPSTAELSGSFYYANIGNSYSRGNLILISPGFNWYIKYGLFFGPILSYSNVSGNGYSDNSLSAGGQIGKSFKLDKILPFVSTGAAFLMVTEHNTGRPGFGFPISAGIKWMVVEHFAINFSADYRFGYISGHNDVTQNLYFGAGISGFLY